jgi:cysteine synthase B
MDDVAMMERRVHESILETIGNTPLLRFQKLTRHLPPGVELYAKAEYLNPGGSVKDRAAFNMILDGERSGRLTRDKIIMDSTSGNTGIAYAMMGAAKGYRVRLVMPANVSLERKLTVENYGAEVVFSDPMQQSDGAIRKARQMLSENPDLYFYPDQYNNPANWQAHYNTTGVEIWEQTGGRVTHLVAGIGTSGTLMGTGRRLKNFNPNVKIVAVEPDESLHGLEGLKHMPTALKPGIYDESLHDEKISVATEDAYAIAERLAKEEGMLVGHSAGAAMWAALKVAERLTESVVVTIFPDGGDRYLSTMPR